MNIVNRFYLSLALLITPFSLATTIQKFTFEEMVDLSELIIEARVDAVSTYASEELVYTRVLFRVEQVLKGDNPGEFVELDFLGGAETGRVVEISGQDIPERGEHGFFFIESTAGKSVNPLVGWSQGHFRILTDAEGNQALETDIKQEVLPVDGASNTAMANKLRNMKFSGQQLEEAAFTPVTPDELRDAVAAFLGE